MQAMNPPSGGRAATRHHEKALSYAVITPARDEASTLPRLSCALEAQTLPPASWTIVENGSTDETLEVILSLQRSTSFIHLLALETQRRLPTRGGPIALAFESAIAVLSVTPDIVAKVDADVSMDPDYFELLCEKFLLNQKLGIASGLCFENHAGSWKPHFSTGKHVEPQCRAYRWDCLLDVLPLEREMGWDGIDVIRANLCGWTTEVFKEVTFRHHRAMGQRDGSRARAWAAQGRASHYAGYRLSYTVARAAFRACREIWALALIWGHLHALLRNKPQCEDVAVRAYLRRQQRLRAMARRAREALGGVSRLRVSSQLMRSGRQ
jgi:biofilm PGA synthesis N-glycosyltransferase PgaC